MIVPTLQMAKVRCSKVSGLTGPQLEGVAPSPLPTLSLLSDAPRPPPFSPLTLDPGTPLGFHSSPPPIVCPESSVLQVGLPGPPELLGEMLSPEP